MNKVTATTIRKQWCSVIRNGEHGERTVILRRGRPAAAIIPYEDYELIQQLRARQQRTKN